VQQHVLVVSCPCCLEARRGALATHVVMGAVSAQWRHVRKEQGADGERQHRSCGGEGGKVNVRVEKEVKRGKEREERVWNRKMKGLWLHGSSSTKSLGSHSGGLRYFYDAKRFAILCVGSRHRWAHHPL